MNSTALLTCAEHVLLLLPRVGGIWVAFPLNQILYFALLGRWNQLSQLPALQDKQ